MDFNGYLPAHGTLGQQSRQSDLACLEILAEGQFGIEKTMNTKAAPLTGDRDDQGNLESALACATDRAA